jgi:iron(III) transport system ATP-binding protein
MLSIKKVSFAYNTPILSGVTFDLNEKEFIGIVGESGSGKTTLLKIIAGLIEPIEGNVFFENEKVKGPSELLIPGHDEIKLVNQDFSLDLYHTVRENIREKILYLKKEEREELIEELLDLMELKTIEQQQAISLSGGEQQRLAFARALACEPKVLLLDEPFAHLDFKLKNKITNYLLDLKFIRGLSVIIVTHNGEEVLSMSDRIIHFGNGKINRVDSAENFYFKPISKQEAMHFGMINEVQVGDDKKLFRPNDYRLEFSSEFNQELKVVYTGSQFTGPYYLNFFTFEGEQIVLFSENVMTELVKIYIK